MNKFYYIPAPYTSRRVARGLFADTHVVLFEDTELRLLTMSDEDVKDIVVLLNAAYQVGRMEGDVRK